MNMWWIVIEFFPNLSKMSYNLLFLQIKCYFLSCDP